MEARGRVARRCDLWAWGQAGSVQTPGEGERPRRARARAPDMAMPRSRRSTRRPRVYSRAPAPSASISFIGQRLSHHTHADQRSYVTPSSEHSHTCIHTHTRTDRCTQYTPPNANTPMRMHTSRTRTAYSRACARFTRPPLHPPARYAGARQVPGTC